MKIAAAIIVAVLCLVGAVAGNYALSIRLQDENNTKFCYYLESVVPKTRKPENPAANPSRAASYSFTVKTDRFEKTLGCK